MRLFLSDSFFEKFADLPRNVQQNVREFQRKFRENSTSSAIHLEPIYDCSDSSLKSARVNGAYRAIVGTKDNVNFVCLYVDKHDNAYEWAKNKKFEWNEHTQAYQIIPVHIESESLITEPQSNFVTDNSHVSSPLSAFTDEQLLSIGIPAELISKTRSIKDLDDLDVAESFLPHDAFENIFALLDGIDIQEIINEINEGKVTKGDELLSPNNRRRFVEITSDEDLSRILAEGIEKWQVFLHPSQHALVFSSFPGTVKVSGSAGTGKTVAAIHRLANLVRNPEAKVLFTTYTNALANNINTLVRNLNLPANRYELLNIDKLLKKLALKLGVITPQTTILDFMGADGEKSKALWREILDNEVTEFNETFLYDEYLDVIVYNNLSTLADYLKQSRVGRTKSISRRQRLEIWKLVEKYIELKKERNAVDRLELFNLVTMALRESGVFPYSNVIVDEFQDYSNPELRFIRALANEGPNDLFLTGDPYQRIYSGRKINFSKAGINVKGKRSRKLKVNYRTTEEIKRLAVAVVKGVNYDDLDGGEENNKGYISIMHGDKPEYFSLNNSNEECDAVITFIENCISDSIPLSSICIAAPKKSLYRDILDSLYRKRIPYKEIKSGKSIGDQNGVTVCSFHALKGLEFQVVCLVGVNELSMPSVESSLPNYASLDVIERKEALSEYRSLLYVAITRGREKVQITGYGKKTNLL